MWKFTVGPTTLLLAALLLAAPAQAQSACEHRLFVSGYFSTVHVFDACTGAYLRDLDTGARIRGAQAVKLGPDGLLYVTSEMSGQILRYRNDSLDFVDVFATIPGIDPTGFAFAPNGEVYVAGFRTSEVRRLSATGDAIDIPVPTGAAGLSGPDNGITFGPDGNLYVPGYYSSSVIRHDPRTGVTNVAVAARAQGLFNTRGLLADRGGTAMFVTGEGSGQLLRFDLATGAVAVLARNLLSPTGIDYAPDGDVLILHGNNVARFDPVTGAAKGTLVALPAVVQGGTYLAVIARPPPAKSSVIEYYNQSLDHYFVSALPADIAALDSGTLRGWARTGLTFDAYLSPAAGSEREGPPRARTSSAARSAEGIPLSPVCRYYLPPANGDSHFYSASPAECAEVGVRFPTFVLEASDVMYIALPDLATGACPPGTVKVFRLWNNRADSNHRYTTDPAVKAAMLARGYIAEGYGPDATIMCAAG